MNEEKEIGKLYTIIIVLSSLVGAFGVGASFYLGYYYASNLLPEEPHKITIERQFRPLGEYIK